MAKNNRQNISNWEYGARCFLLDITDQVELPGFEDDPKIKQSKFTMDEGQRMLHDLADALGMEWPEFVKLLSKAWRKRRRQKCKRLGWYDDDELPGKSKSASAQ